MDEGTAPAGGGAPEATLEPPLDAFGADAPLYRQARQELASPKPPRLTGLLFVGLFILFVVRQFVSLESVSGIVVLLLVLAFHEGGHALGMRLFGFRDVRMFFIPFFGAAVSGRPRGVAAWKEALVSLMGPLPGIVAGLVVFLLTQRTPTALSMSVVQMLLLLNLFNLLPFGFLDGGRFLGRVLLSRHRALDVTFQAVGSLLLAYIALRGEMYVVAFFALFGLFTLSVRWRVLKAAVALRRQFPGLVADPNQLGDAEARATFVAARDLVSGPAREKPTALANVMEQIVEAAKPAPGLGATLALLALYGVGLAVGAFAAVMLALQFGPVNWKPFAQPEWTAEFPRPPHEYTLPADGGGTTRFWRTVAEGTQRFTVGVTDPDTAPGQAWPQQRAEHLAREMGMNIVDARPCRLSGEAGTEYELATSGRIAHARIFVVGKRVYELVASAPAWGANQRRFFDSFLIGPGIQMPRPSP
jgi:Zn-dependent protease